MHPIFLGSQRGIHIFATKSGHSLSGSLSLTLSLWLSLSGSLSLALSLALDYNLVMIMIMVLVMSLENQMNPYSKLQENLMTSLS